MTAAEYFGKVLPTEEDFKAWTRSLFERADAAKKRAVERLRREIKDEAGLELVFEERAA